MVLTRLADQQGRVARYYLNGGINIVFGYGVFSLLIALGTNLFAAQLMSHVMGVAFNYFTFSRFTFRDRIGSKIRFVLAYVTTYLVSLLTLFGVSRFIPSAYLAGFLTTVFVSILNYFVLGNLVFRREAAKCAER